MVGERRARGTVGVLELAGDCRRRQQGLAVRRVANLPLGLPQPDQQIAALGRIAARLAAQLERLAEPAEGLVGRELPERALTRAARVIDGLLRVVRRRRAAPVMGELRDPIARVVAAQLLEHLGDPAVEPGSARAAQVLVERVVDERVGEREATGDACRLDEDRRGDRLLE